MTGGALAELRRQYHAAVFERVLRTNAAGVPNNADKSSRGSVEISRGILREIALGPISAKLPGQTSGKQFEEVTLDFLRSAFAELQHLRPGEWTFSLGASIDRFAQYRHLADIAALVKSHQALRTAFGDYIVKPDIVVCRAPVQDAIINIRKGLVDGRTFAAHTPLRASNSSFPLLHASVSCKWTIRSDRSQNARTEGLNLIRNRKGGSPHVTVVTGEPLPSRIATLALGTGDIDCVYHFALPELQTATAGRDSDLETLTTLVDGGRLRDISDLPLDLAA